MFQKKDVDFAPNQLDAEPLNPFAERLKQTESGAESNRKKTLRNCGFTGESKPAASEWFDSETPEAAESFIKRIRKKLDRASQTAEPMISEQGAIPSGSAQLTTELEHHAKRFAYLLETTYTFLNDLRVCGGHIQTNSLQGNGATSWTAAKPRVCLSVLRICATREAFRQIHCGSGLTN